MKSVIMLFYLAKSFCCEKKNSETFLSTKDRIKSRAQEYSYTENYLYFKNLSETYFHYNYNTLSQNMREYFIMLQDQHKKLPEDPLLIYKIEEFNFYLAKSIIDLEILRENSILSVDPYFTLKRKKSDLDNIYEDYEPPYFIKKLEVVTMDIYD